MKKQVKKILFISDDFMDTFDIVKELCEDGIYYFHEESNFLKFKFSLSEDFESIPKKIDKFDAVMVDYGLLSNDKNIEELVNFYALNIPIIWCGAMPHWYNEDCQREFPKRKFLHNLRVSGLDKDDILFALYKTFEEQI